jgi:hypothetical protein
MNLPLHYLSHETLVLHGATYMNYLCNLYDFPALDAKKVNNIVKDSNSNKKYINDIEEHWLDKKVNEATEESKEPLK